MQPLLALHDVAKTFRLHLRGGAELAVMQGVTFAVLPGECVILGGPSGIGKSSLLKLIYGNYRCDIGRILLRDGDDTVDLTQAEPRRIVQLRRNTLGYVSQFLRVIPRVATLDIVAAAGREGGMPAEAATRRAKDLLVQLNLPERLWSLPPATFSGGEQQRVNLARGLIGDHPVLLLDEPTASLDAANRAVAVALIEERKQKGCAIVGICHDEAVRDAIATRVVDVTRFAASVAA